MTIIPQKRCTRCGAEKPLTEFGSNPIASDGHFNQCKLCIRYRCVPDEEYFTHISQGLRRCSKCKTWKPIDQFVVCTQRQDGIAAHCIACHRNVSNDYVARNRKKVLRIGNEWRRANREHHLASRKAWRARHADQERARNRAWQKRNLDRVKANIHRRAARMKGNGGSYTVVEWQALCERHDNRCLCCGERRKLTVDHIIPVSLGGSNAIDNIQPLCKPCNSAKRTKIIDYRTAIDAEL